MDLGKDLGGEGRSDPQSCSMVGEDEEDVAESDPEEVITEEGKERRGSQWVKQVDLH